MFHKQFGEATPTNDTFKWVVNKWEKKNQTFKDFKNEMPISSKMSILNQCLLLICYIIFSGFNA